MSASFSMSAPLSVNRVPEVTMDFWIVKLLAVTVGETAADHIIFNLGYGLQTTSMLMTALLAVVLALQFSQRRYIPWSYWLAVVMVSVVGTLVTDSLVDNYGIALETTTIVFAVLLTATFAAWYAVERTLSIHTVYTFRREAFYWLAILLTFALGTAAGDLIAETFDVGYLNTGLLFAAVIAGIAVAWYAGAINAILAFWLAYILTRPLGASLGDLLSQSEADGGMGLGTTVTSTVFLVAIAAVVVYMTFAGNRDTAPSSNT